MKDKIQIFTTDNMEAEPLVTDEAARLSSIHGAMKRSWLPILAISICTNIIQLFMQITRIAGRDEYPQEVMKEGLLSVGLLCLAVLFLLWMIIDYTVWYFQSKKRIKAGGCCAKRRYWVAAGKIVILILIFVLLWGKSFPGVMVTVAMLGAMLLAIYISIQISVDLKENGASRKKNIAITAGSTAVLTLIAFVLIIFFVLMFGIFG